MLCYFPVLKIHYANIKLRMRVSWQLNLGYHLVYQPTYISQRSPVYSGVHLHLATPEAPTHVPPFSQYIQSHEGTTAENNRESSKETVERRYRQLCLI